MYSFALCFANFAFSKKKNAFFYQSVDVHTLLHKYGKVEDISSFLT